MKHRRGLVVTVALLALAAAACSGGSGDSPVPEASAALRVLAGMVEVRPPSADFAAALDGQALQEGFTIRTGADGRAAIEYFDGSVTRLDENTTFTIVTLQILDNADRSKVIEGEQSSGSTYNRVTELTDSASRFDVTTPTATASVQGTIYAIFVNPVTGESIVAVLDGTVAVGGAAVPAGFMVTVGEDGVAGEPVPIPDDLIDSDWIVFNCEADGGIVDEDGNCVLGAPTTTTTVAETTTTTVAETTTTSSATTTSTTTTTTAPPAPTTTTTTTTTTIPPEDCGDVGEGSGTTIVFDPGNGTCAGPDSIGGYAMTPFGADGSDSPVSGVESPSGDSIGFDQTLDHVTIGSGWATWSHGYLGDVYIVPGGVMITITLPAGTLAFSFFAEPDAFEVLDITAIAQDGTSSGGVPVDGSAGATFFGFYTTDPEVPLECISVGIDDEGGFAIGEFAITQDPEALGESAPACVEEGSA